ncbi:MAG TPA: CYTH domain-containing protein, partial [Actinomycetota bacterium]|nr:CYTH domain-containing protein [Actinomycetota bacterium]
MGDPDEALEDPTPPDARVAQLPDDPADEIYQDPQDAVEVSPPVDVVTIDHAEVLEPPQVDPETDVSPPAAEDDSTGGGPVAMHTLRVHGLFRLPDLSAAEVGVSRAKRQVLRNLSAVYHDTDDLRLARWEVTLRRRQGGVDEGWHLQLPVESQPGIREEVHLPLSAGEVGDVPHDMR